MEQVRRAVDRNLKEAVARLSRNAPRALVRSIRYSLFGGGKRIRPVLTCAVCEALGGRRSDALPAAAAIELIHTYSLVHDDLPPMDDDDLRRGKPTNHKVFGEAMAILAGDALQAAAFDLLSREGNGAADQVGELSRAAGACGMVGGQVMDLDGGRIRRPGDLEAIYLKKTAALFEASARMGARAAGASPGVLRRAGAFGRYVGLAFQITDDILDASQDSALAVPEREAASFPNRFGLARARRRAARYARRCRTSIPVAGPKAGRLKQIVDYIDTRCQ